jgi:hypothetical protein
MGRFALLIGVSESREEDLPASPWAIADIKAMESVLQNPDLGGFNSVTVMSNPTREEMELAIETLFTNCKREDLVLCYFSGHGVIDNRDGKFYLVLPQTRKARGELVRTTAVAGTFLQYIMTVSRSKHQVLILDSCFSAAIADGMTVKSAEKVVDIHRELGGEGRAILTSSSALEKSVHIQGYDLSIYTHYLIEGIQTGAANQNGGDYITVKELHEYVEAKLKLEVPQMSPQFFPVRDGYEINLVRSPKPKVDPELEYRKEAERLVTDEGFTSPAKRILMMRRLELEVLDDKAEAIESEVLRVCQEYRRKQKFYYDSLRDALEKEAILSPHVLEHLAELYRRLKLKEADAIFEERRALNGLSLSEFVARQRQKTEQDNPDLDLLMPLPLTSKEINEGSTKEILLDDGQRITVNIPAGVKEGQKLRIKGKGRINLNTQEQGDLYLLITQSDAAKPQQFNLVALKSEKGTDYSRLRDLLVGEKWREADLETHKMIAQVINRHDSSYTASDLLQFSSIDLITIDKLWKTYSRGKFGFSVQKQIYKRIGAQLDGRYPGNEVWKKFLKAVGWGYAQSLESIKFDISAPEGHLPLLYVSEGHKSDGWMGAASAGMIVGYVGWGDWGKGTYSRMRFRERRALGPILSHGSL